MSHVTEREGPGAALKARWHAKLKRLKPLGSSLVPLTKPKGQHPERVQPSKPFMCLCSRGTKAV